jgi:hypothetical protein
MDCYSTDLIQPQGCLALCVSRMENQTKNNNNNTREFEVLKAEIIMLVE